MSSCRSHHLNAFPQVPVQQLGYMVAAEAFRRGVHETDLAKEIKIADKRFREWRSRPTKLAYFDTVDKVLTALGLLWWDVWTPQNSTPHQLAIVRYAFECSCGKQPVTTRVCDCGAAEGDEKPSRNNGDQLALGWAA